MRALPFRLHIQLVYKSISSFKYEYITTTLRKLISGVFDRICSKNTFQTMSGDFWYCHFFKRTDLSLCIFLVCFKIRIRFFNRRTKFPQLKALYGSGNFNVKKLLTGEQSVPYFELESRQLVNCSNATVEHEILAPERLFLQFMLVSVIPGGWKTPNHHYVCPTILQKMLISNQ